MKKKLLLIQKYLKQGTLKIFYLTEAVQYSLFSIQLSHFVH